MSYPFSGNPYAQHESGQAPLHDQHATYHDPYGEHAGATDAYSASNHNEAYYSQNGYGSYDYAHGSGYAGDYDDAYARAQADAPYADDEDEMTTKDAPAGVGGKLNDEGQSPYYVQDRGNAGLIRTGGSVWLPEQKRQMQQRSAIAKICRVFFCTIFTTVFIIISIISLVVIFARPFNVGVGNVAEPSSSSVGISGSTLTFNGTVDFIISNPNSISTGLTIDAKVYDAVDKSQEIGRGSISHKKINPNANTTITFPYQILYNPTKDSQKLILKDLAEKCGLTGNAVEDLNLDLEVSASVKILSVAVPVSFSHAINIECPVSADILKQLAGNDISSIIGSIGRRGNGDGDKHSEF